MNQADNTVDKLAALTPAVRRRNRLVGLLLTTVALLAALWSSWAVHHHWIYPAATTWSWHFKFK